MPKLLILVFSIFYSALAIATPFDICPSKAYLFQANPVQVYGVNLVTGQTSLLESDTGINANINAVGFDFQDRYIYGYDTSNKRLVRLGKDFQAQILNTSGLPTDHTFFVGDVYEHVFYLYRKGKGIFKVDLSPLDSDPNAVLDVIKISSIATVSLTDFAFHPGDGNLYGVDNSTGNLYRFDTDVGGEIYIGNVGVTGTFGAGYFDVNGYYYISRNSDGNIYRIDLSSQDNIDNGIVTAVKFADGPSSNQNDGARCANAPVIDEDSTIDFGDAPDSYVTLLASNGPRHAIDGITWLGNVAPDGEQDGLLAPLNDNKAGYADEDGVGFVTAIEAGTDAIVVVQASTTGYLSAWFDWNQDGDFDDAGEKVFSDVSLTAGSNTLFYPVPNSAVMGETWTRFRFSQQTGLDYFGGAQSGEVEDHQILISVDGVAIRYYPSASGYATVAFEDNWPFTVDYDMNDVVIRYRVTETLTNGTVTQSKIEGYLAAYGAGFHNGFAVRLAGLARADIDEALTRQLHNGVQLAHSGLEADSSEAIFIISNKLSDYVSVSCEYFRTLSNCHESLNFSFTINITLKDGADTSELMAMPYDPFIFATPGYYHGEGLPFQPGRSWEVHLADHAPTEKFDSDNLLGLGEDSSNAVTGRYFKTNTNLPFALMVTDEWKWPLEKVDLVNAYPDFAAYAESGGQQKQNWYLLQNAVTSRIYQEGE
ncbi:LruC domain-containing protein [Vibrio sp. NTOU-M3]|uniref:LruC domain-containing protein n=1 Tax=Vibrio sp. NTOU-M3 TaxID=3234954 RepID=UPI00349F8EEE